MPFRIFFIIRLQELLGLYRWRSSKNRNTFVSTCAASFFLESIESWDFKLHFHCPSNLDFENYGETPNQMHKRLQNQN